MIYELSDPLRCSTLNRIGGMITGALIEGMITGVQASMLSPCTSISVIHNTKKNWIFGQNELCIELNRMLHRAHVMGWTAKLGFNKSHRKHLSCLAPEQLRSNGNEKDSDSTDRRPPFQTPYKDKRIGE